MSIQAISTPPVALSSLPPLENAVPTPQQDGASQEASREASGITITRIDQQDYPDGYVVTTTHYANKDSASRSAPKTAPLARSAFDPSNGGQLSALLSAQEQSQTPAQSVVPRTNPYTR
jgi:hypothetical protein